MNNYISTWLPNEKLLITRLGGLTDLKAVKTWEYGIIEALSLIPDNSEFKVLVNLHGFKANDLSTHKYYRSIIPDTLALFGWRIGYLNLFKEADDLLLRNIRGISCKAAAHVHHDTSKIEKYQTLFAHPHEHYFTNPIRARHWIDKITI